MGFPAYSGRSLGRSQKGILIIVLPSDHQLPHHLCASTDAQKCKLHTTTRWASLMTPPPYPIEAAVACDCTRPDPPLGGGAPQHQDPGRGAGQCAARYQ